MTPIKPTQSESNVPLDVVFEALSRGPRRHVLESLCMQTPRIAEEFEERPFWPAGADEDEIAIQLHHSHLPRLDDAGFIDWNAETGTIVTGPNFEQIRPLLELLGDHEGELSHDWP